MTDLKMCPNCGNRLSVSRICGAGYFYVCRRCKYAKTEDAVPVVQCKDCRKFAPYSDKFKNEHYDTKDGECMMLAMCVYEWQDAGRYNDDFCSHGEQKEAK